MTTCKRSMARRISRWVFLAGLAGTIISLIYAYSIVMTCRDVTSSGMCVVGKMYERASQTVMKAIPPSCSEEKSRKYLSQMVK